MQRLVLIAVALAVTATAGLGAEPDPQRWEAAIAKFEAKDAVTPPAPGGVLFVGSSSIVGWKLDRWFPERGFLNRGFGGSHLSDSLYYADRIILKYQPAVIVLYAGDNDIASGKPPERIRDDFAALAEKIATTLPEAKLVVVGIKPSPKRWALLEKLRAANAYVRDLVAKHEGWCFIDLEPTMLDANGQPRQELYKSDLLHLNDEGYRLWNELVGPHLPPAK
ncbi:MAG: hypothetical protein HUU35_00160 [Armatimonadetes bacterium]|nr:hypothetical protein [Armatimonadota bacterium]